MRSVTEADIDGDRRTRTFDPVAVDRRVRTAKVGEAVASEEAEP